MNLAAWIKSQARGSKCRWCGTRALVSGACKCKTHQLKVRAKPARRTR